MAVSLIADRRNVDERGGLPLEEELVRLASCASIAFWGAR
jgi:hypothetical protein